IQLRLTLARRSCGLLFVGGQFQNREGCAEKADNVVRHFSEINHQRIRQFCDSIFKGPIG
ncbi:hypothetical protein, partial [Salmonella enterica]|uniref:hypothetical protein n=1 Tax=Salmonella enterica TaxID=28901 RepID=UPI00398C743E